MKAGFSKYIIFAGVAFALTLLVSCQKVVHLNLGSTPPQLVVEGAIETGQPPYVFLTTTLSFFSQVNLSTVQGTFVHGATVQVSCGSRTTTLREYSFDTSGGNLFYIYTIDTANLSNIIIGQVDSFYKLTIVYNGNTFTSTVKIPAPKGVDSLWFGPPTLRNSRTPNSAKQLFCNYTDPDTPGNYVRYFTKRNNEIFFPSQLFSDEVVNGKYVPNIGLAAGYDPTQDANNDSLIYFYPGDSVVLKWCEIDRSVYNFWNTLQFANNALGNPFATPINVQSNISNGALGIWAGYGSVVYPVMVVPH